MHTGRLKNQQATYEVLGVPAPWVGSRVDP